MTAIARPGSPKLQQLQHDGGVVNTKGERAEIQVADVPDKQAAYDLVLSSRCLLIRSSAVLPGLQRTNAKWIKFMFNTFEPKRL